MLQLDLNTYNMTSDLPGGPALTMVEQETAVIHIVAEEEVQPTRGGAIGDVLAYVLITAFVGAIFYLL